MSDTFTGYANLIKPEPGASDFSWGVKTNSNWDIISTKLYNVEVVSIPQLNSDIALKANITSPVFSGIPTVPTATTGLSNLQIANTQFTQTAVGTAVTGLIGGAPSGLNNLQKIASALNNDPNYFSTINSTLSIKANISSPIFTDSPRSTTPSTSDSSDRIATTAYVQAGLASYTSITYLNTVLTSYLTVSSANTQFSGKADKSGGIFTGNITVGTNGVSASILTTSGDAILYRTDNTGMLYMNKDGNRYLYNDNNTYILNGNNLLVRKSGSKVSTLVERTDIGVGCELMATSFTSTIPNLGTTYAGGVGTTTIHPFCIGTAGVYSWIYSGTIFRGYADGINDLGEPDVRFHSIFLQNAPNVLSDIRSKNVIGDAPGLDFIEKLRPVKYTKKVGSGDINTDYNVTYYPGKRTHYGLIAQEVKEAVGEENFAGWCLSKKDDPDSRQSLVYEEFIAPLIKSVQELKEQIDALKKEIVSLKRKK